MTTRAPLEMLGGDHPGSAVDGHMNGVRLMSLLVRRLWLG
jgi:hypothetical protein